MTYGIMNGPRKGPKTISREDEEMLVGSARTAVESLEDWFPDAREVDLLNAFILVFIERTRE